MLAASSEMTTQYGRFASHQIATIITDAGVKTFRNCDARDGQVLSDNIQQVLSGSPLKVHAASLTLGSVLQ
jgi:hypothetical protein